jgi:hypothetical protein
VQMTGAILAAADVCQFSMDADRSRIERAGLY